MAKTPESYVKGKIVAYLKERGAFYAHISQNGYSWTGMPDGIVCYKGMFIGLESKAPGKKVDRWSNQMMFRDMIVRAGGLWFQVSSLDRMKEILDRIDSGEYNNGQQREEYGIERGR